MSFACLVRRARRWRGVGRVERSSKPGRDQFSPMNKIATFVFFVRQYERSYARNVSKTGEFIRHHSSLLIREAPALTIA
ncbi:MAG: hypothetical protein M3R68_02485 [Acidobacteriota bacterium]|nr:hypothetical protein [Acidobacteriota bacterium]